MPSGAPAARAAAERVEHAAIAYSQIQMQAVAHNFRELVRLHRGFDLRPGPLEPAQRRTLMRVAGRIVSMMCADLAEAKISKVTDLSDFMVETPTERSRPIERLTRALSSPSADMDSLCFTAPELPRRRTAESRKPLMPRLLEAERRCGTIDNDPSRNAAQAALDRARAQLDEVERTLSFAHRRFIEYLG